MVNIDIEIQRWQIERLRPRTTNPRTHSDHQVAQLAASIRAFGWTNPILVGTEGDVIAGHACLEAARAMQMTEVPVIVLGRCRAYRRAGCGNPACRCDRRRTRGLVGRAGRSTCNGVCI